MQKILRDSTIIFCHSKPGNNGLHARFSVRITTSKSVEIVIETLHDLATCPIFPVFLQINQGKKIL